MPIIGICHDAGTRIKLFFKENKTDSANVFYLRNIKERIKFPVLYL